jgi:hypothetical protein
MIFFLLLAFLLLLLFCAFLLFCLLLAFLPVACFLHVACVQHVACILRDAGVLHVVAGFPVVDDILPVTGVPAVADFAFFALVAVAGGPTCYAVLEF